MSSPEVEQSFRNLVMFYSKELKLINDGHSPTKFFNDVQRKKLTNVGVLDRIYVHQGCRLILSEKAKTFLGFIDKFNNGKNLLF